MDGSRKSASSRGAFYDHRVEATRAPTVRQLEPRYSRALSDLLVFEGAKDPLPSGVDGTESSSCGKFSRICRPTSRTATSSPRTAVTGNTNFTIVTPRREKTPSARRINAVNSGPRSARPSSYAEYLTPGIAPSRTTSSPDDPPDSTSPPSRSTAS
ncbi:hypothetical protein KM043_003694 [Ampulex compressa]|nr:hypothetical protein KM043_003694 [Ampulex compressa]